MTGMRHRLIVLPALALPCAALAGVAHHPAPKPVHAATAPTPAAVSAPVAATHRAPVARIAAVKAVHHTAQVRHAMHTVGTMAAPVPAPAPAPALAMHALPPAGPSQAMAVAASSGWNPAWRSDPRYDYERWRLAQAGLFRPGPYRPPLGVWAYAALGSGAVLAAAYITDETILGDPALYHLPPVGEPLRWVRYYNDALLVNIDTGQVFDAVPGLFR